MNKVDILDERDAPGRLNAAAETFRRVRDGLNAVIFGQDAVIEENGHVGHGAVLHGCIVRREALVGMNSVVMDGAEIGEGSFVGAMSFVRAGMIVPPKTLVAGVPAKIVRELQDKEMAWKANGTHQYQELAKRSLATMKECDPLPAPEADRPQAKPIVAIPLHKIKAAG